MTRSGPARNSSISSKPGVGDPVGMARFVDQVVRAVDTPLAATVATLAAQVGGARRVLVQVVDRNRHPLTGRFVVQVYAASAAGGDPWGTPTFGAPVKGVLLSSGGDVRTYLTDARGRAEFDLTRGSGGSLVVASGVGGTLAESAPAAFV